MDLWEKKTICTYRLGRWVGTGIYMDIHTHIHKVGIQKETGKDFTVTLP